MQQMMFIIYDIKTQLYDNPFFAKSFGEVTRMLDQTLQEGRSTIAKYPSDFKVFHTGTYDPYDGTVECLDKPIYLGFVDEMAKGAKPKLPEELLKYSLEEMTEEDSKEMEV